MIWYLIAIIMLSVALLYFIIQTIYYHYFIGEIRDYLVELKKKIKREEWNMTNREWLNSLSDEEEREGLKC